MNRTVLEELVVKFIGDASQFNKVVDQVKRTADRAAKQISDAFAGVKPTPPAAMLSTGFSNFPTGFATYGRQVRRVQQRAAMQINPINTGFSTFPASPFGLYPMQPGGAPHMPGAAGGLAIARINQGISAFGSGVSATFANIEKRINNSKIIPSLHRIGYEFRVAGQAMQRYFTYPIVALGAASVYSFAKFDDALTAAAALFGDVSEQTKQAMKNTIFDISAKSRLGPIELAASLRHLASANYSVGESLKIVGLINEFVVGGMYDLKDAGTGYTNTLAAVSKATEDLIHIQGALNMRSSNSAKNLQNLTHIAEVMAVANKLALGSVEDFADALTNKAAVSMRTMNISMEQGVAVLAALAQQGKKGAVGGEQFSIFTRELGKAAILNQNQWRQFLGRDAVFDAEGELLNLGDILKKLENQFKGVGVETKLEALRLLGFADRSSIAVKTLLGFSDVIGKFQSGLQNAGGVLHELYQIRMTSFTSKLMMMWNQVKIAAINFGEELAPAIEYVTQKIVALVKWWENLNPQTRRFIAYGMALLAIAGPIIAFFGAAAISAAALTSTIVFLIANFWIVASVLVFVGAASAQLAFDWYFFGDAITYAGKNLIGFTANFNQNMRSIYKWLGANWVQILGDMSHNFGVAIGGLVRIMAAFGGWLLSKFADVFESVFTGRFVKSAAKGINTVVGWFQSLTKIIADAIAGDVTAVTSGVGGLGKELSKAIGQDITHAFITGNLQQEIDRIVADIKKDMTAIGGPNLDLSLPKHVQEVINLVDAANKSLEGVREETKTPIRAIFETKGVESLIKGTAEAEAAILHYIDTLPDLQRNAYLQNAYGPTRPDMIPIAAHPETIQREGVDGLLQKLLEAVKEGNAIAEDEPGIELVPANLEK